MGRLRAKESMAKQPCRRTTNRRHRNNRRSSPRLRHAPRTMKKIMEIDGVSRSGPPCLTSSAARVFFDGRLLWYACTGAGSLVVIQNWTMILVSTAKRLHRIAQGCRAAATLGKNSDKLVNPEGVLQRVLYQFSLQKTVRTGNSLPERALRNPFRVHLFTRLVTQGSRSARQPWAILLNRFAVGNQKLCITTRAGSTEPPRRVWAQ